MVRAPHALRRDRARPVSEQRLPDAIQPKREAMIDRLREHYAGDDLGIEEFERRVDVAIRAPSNADLERLVSDLPTPSPPHLPLPPLPLPLLHN